MILHSRQDDVIPFADSEELVANSGLPPETLIEVGNDHRLADPEPLKAMLEACEQFAKAVASEQPDEMNECGGRSMTFWTVGKTSLRIYGFLWMAAVGGILGANLVTAIGMLLFSSENNGVNVQPWAHYGWYGETALFLIGAILGKPRFINGTALGGRSKPPVDSSSATRANDATTETPAQSDEQSRVPGFLFVCGLAGAFLGLLLGVSLLVFSISYAYSPFASQKAVSSVKVVQQQAPGTHAYDGPSFKVITLLRCISRLTPAVLGAILGAIGGGFVVWKYREGHPATEWLAEASNQPTAKRGCRRPNH